MRTLRGGVAPLTDAALLPHCWNLRRESPNYRAASTRPPLHSQPMNSLTLLFPDLAMIVIGLALIVWRGREEKIEAIRE